MRRSRWGHKGAGGMLGSGILYVQDDLQNDLEPLWIGGTGTQSESISGPFDWLSAIESGNSNLPAIASLQSGIEWLAKQPPSERLNRWIERILAAIAKVPTLELVGSRRHRVPVISVCSRRSNCHEMAMLLDAACNVEARSGLHCAGLIHTYLGTKDLGGTLRLSLGHTSCEADIDAAIEGIEMLRSVA
jgi:cysteine desulfurase / selenocysteine lyase